MVESQTAKCEGKQLENEILYSVFSSTSQQDF